MYCSAPASMYDAAWDLECANQSAGPRLFAVPGDVLNIVFRNNLNYTVNIIPSGAVTNSTEVAEAGQTITYQWTIGSEVR